MQNGDIWSLYNALWLAIASNSNGINIEVGDLSAELYVFWVRVATWIQVDITERLVKSKLPPLCVMGILFSPRRSDVYVSH